jgi:hypothetical protein
MDINELLVFFQDGNKVGINLECNRGFYDLITTVFKKLPNNNPEYVNPGYSKDMVTTVNEKFHPQHWNITFYIFDGNRYDLSLSCYINKDNEYYIDRYGNFYLNEEMFLSTLPSYTTCVTHRGKEKYPIPQNDLFVPRLKAGMEKLFGETGLMFFNNRCKEIEDPKNDSALILREVKFVYPLFDILLLLNLPPIKFEDVCNKSLTIKIGDERSWNLNFTECCYKRRCLFKKYVQNSATTCAFENKCKAVIEELFASNKIQKPKAENMLKKFEEYKWNINKKFSKRKTLGNQIMHFSGIVPL